MAEIRALAVDLQEEIRDFQEQGAAFLAVSQESAPADIVERINSFVRQLKQDEKSLSEDVVISLGVLLGEQYVRRFQWHWGEVIFDGDEENSQTCVLSPNNGVAINPIWWVNNVVSTGRPTNFLLNFNMVADGRLPNAQANEALGFH